MHLKEISDKQLWENFILECTEKTFLQSWHWGEFQKSLGHKIWRWGIYDNQKLVSVLLAFKISAKRGSFLLAPHGPIEKNQTAQQKFQLLEIFLEELKKIARAEKVSYIRVCPIWEKNPANEKIFADLNFRPAPLHTHPESSWKLNLQPSTSELLSQMRKTTRYLIKQAEKNPDIEIFQSTDVKDLEIFNKIHLAVVKVQKFVPFSLEYFQKEFLAFAKDNQIAIFFAKYRGKVVAAAYEIFYSRRAFYHHAALLPSYKKIPLAYILQWRAIQEAQKRNCLVYDFWGYADPLKNPNHPYAGPTLFKMGFGGYKDEYVKTQDYIISNLYWLNYLIEKTRKIIRKL